MHRKSMNHIYRLIWSQVLNAWVAVAETGRGRGKGASRKLKLMAAAALSLTTAFSPLAQAAPVDGQVVTGAGSISQSGATTTIQQSSQSLSLNWKSFNIAPQETVNFVQPSAAAIAVNRIFDTNGTQILGRLNANGQVYLINPNGILFGQGAQVNVGSLVASTLDMNDASLNGNARTFSGNGTGSVVNQGTINAAKGGYVALLGNTVSNQGTITAPQGTVALGAGSAATLTFQNNSLVRMEVDQSVLNSLAENGGLIRADGGQVIMNAGAKNALLASVVNNTGVIEARTVEHHEGSIILLGGMTAGTVNVGGTLDASAPNGGNGGFIETSAAHVKVADDAKITTAAPQGKAGTWLIDPVDFTIAATGGDITGTQLGTLLGSNSVTIQTATTGTNTATDLYGTTGTNGDIFVNDSVTWSANNTLTLNAWRNININQSITSTGATGKLSLLYGQGAVAAGNTATYTVKAPVNLVAGANFSTKLGSDGTLKNYTVITALGVQNDTATTTLQGMKNSLATNYALGSNIVASATSGWGSGWDIGFTPVGDNSSQNNLSQFTGIFDGLGHTISNLTINRPYTGNVGLFGYVGIGGTVKNVGLVGGNVTGYGQVGALVGIIEIGTISNSYATGSVTGSGFGGFVGGLVGNTLTGTISDSYATGAVTGSGDYVGGLVGATWSGTTISNSYASGAVMGRGSKIGGLVGYASDLSTVSNSHYNIDTVTINGVLTHVTPYGLYNTQYLSWFNNNKVLSIANYASTLPLVGDYYQISSTQGLKDLLGFAGNPAYKFRLTNNLDLTTIKNYLDPNITSGWHIPYFAGVEFDGAGFTLNNLSINQPFNERIGFIGYLASGRSISNLGLTNVDVTGSVTVGGMVGNNYIGTISNSYVAGSVTGSGAVGGLVGEDFGGTISGSYATGTVTGSGGGESYTYVGGLVGTSYGGIISDSHATGTVAGGPGTYVGGLVGYGNSSTISNSYSTKAVSGNSFVGGLVGYNYLNDGGNTISNSYATGTVSGTGNNVGGLVGYNEGTISASYAAGTVTGNDQVGGLVGATTYGTIDTSYATGTVTGNDQVGGLVGYNYGAISDSYARFGTVSGNNYVGGLVGYNKGTISTSYAAGAVTSTGDYSVGGLVGENYGAISNSYATGAVTGYDWVGGLVGYNEGTISTSYAAGAVTGEMDYVGGLVGENWGDIINSFWDSSVNTIGTIGIGSGDEPGSTAMTTAPMKQQVNFTDATSANGGVAPNWDFASTWRIYDGHTYPLLQVFLRPFTITANSVTSQVYSGIPYSGGNGITCSGSGCSDSHLFNMAGFIGTSQGAKNVGSYTLISDAYSDQHGYNITFVNGALAITPATLTYTATPAGQTYGNGNNVFTGGVSGFVNSETLGTATTGTTAFNSTTTATSNVGSYAINGSGLTANNGNYNFVQAAGNATALTINPAPLPKPGTPPEPVLNATSQIQSEFTVFNPLEHHQTLLISPTINNREANAYLQEEVVVDNKETRIGIGGRGPRFEILNGGVKLLVNGVNVDEKDKK